MLAYKTRKAKKKENQNVTLNVLLRFYLFCFSFHNK